MRAGWDFARQRLPRAGATTQALAEAAEDGRRWRPTPPTDAPIDPELALALTAPVPQLEPLPAPEPAGPRSPTSRHQTPADAAGTTPTEATPVAGADGPEADEDGDPEAAPSSRRPLVLLGAVRCWSPSPVPSPRSCGPASSSPPSRRRAAWSRPSARPPPPTR